ncbi:MAG: elongation factor EF-2, partial [Nanoarchaeota archaeon]|nr:elongation factor EF-2 [Nanoarchaeota archaeon]
YGRLFGGTMRKGTEVFLNRAKQKSRIQQVFIANGAKREIVDNIPCGNILAIGGVKTRAGETVTEQETEPFEEITHIFEPVISKAVEAARPSELTKVIEILRVVQKEDPSIKIEIDEESGQHLMHGMGELHLEIIENRIKSEKGVDIKTSPPIVVYRESITKPSQEVEGKSPNKHNKFYFTVEPLPSNVYDEIKSGKIPEGRLKKKNTALRDTFKELGYDTKVADSVKDIFHGNVFLDRTKGQVYGPEVMEMVLDMFEDVMKNGPLAREPCIKVQVSLMDMSLHEDAIHRGPAQVYPAIRDGIRGAMMTGGPIMYEPLQVMLLEAPADFTGTLSKLVNSKRGQIIDLEQNDTQLSMRVKMPVMEMLGWSSDLRSATEGRGISSLVDQMFERLPAELSEKVIANIKSRKGLTEGQVGA